MDDLSYIHTLSSRGTVLPGSGAVKNTGPERVDNFETEGLGNYKLPLPLSGGCRATGAPGEPMDAGQQASIWLKQVDGDELQGAAPPSRVRARSAPDGAA